VKYRPNRPVPRGLISFNELKIILLFAIITQITISFLLNPSLLIFFIIVIAYMGLMSVEFFASRWLKNKIFTYMWTHMLIMPLIDLFATACDWLQYSSHPPKGLMWFLVISFFNGCIIEIGRKTWAPDQEIKGVDSYSSKWGFKNAVLAWLVLVLISIVVGIIVSSYINFAFITSITLIILSFVGIVICFKFMKNQNKFWATKLENFAGIWVTAVYFILGVVPMAIFSFGGHKI
jgi:4-hydroxybenzoate polyprenyltransferase